MGLQAGDFACRFGYLRRGERSVSRDGCFPWAFLSGRGFCESEQGKHLCAATELPIDVSMRSPSSCHWRLRPTPGLRSMFVTCPLPQTLGLLVPALPRPRDAKAGTSDEPACPLGDIKVQVRTGLWIPATDSAARMARAADPTFETSGINVLKQGLHDVARMREPRCWVGPQTQAQREERAKVRTS